MDGYTINLPDDLKLGGADDRSGASWVTEASQSPVPAYVERPSTKATTAGTVL